MFDINIGMLVTNKIAEHNFAFYALVALSSVTSIIPAPLVNNMSTKRQDILAPEWRKDLAEAKPRMIHLNPIL